MLTGFLCYLLFFFSLSLCNRRPDVLDFLVKGEPAVEKAAFRRVLERIEQRLAPLQVQFVQSTGVPLQAWEVFRRAFNKVFEDEGGTERGPFLTAAEIRAKDDLKRELFENCTAMHNVEDGSLSLTVGGEWLVKRHTDQPAVWEATLVEFAVASRNALKPEHRSFKFLFRDKTDAAEVFRADCIQRKLCNRSWDAINGGPGSVLINNELPVMMVNRSDDYAVLHAHGSEEPAFLLVEDVQGNYNGMGGMKVVHFSLKGPFSLGGKNSSQEKLPRPWTSNAAARRLAYNGIMRGGKLPDTFSSLEGGDNKERVARVTKAVEDCWLAFRIVATAVHRVRWGQDRLLRAAVAEGEAAATEVDAVDAGLPVADMGQFDEAFCTANFSGCAEAGFDQWLMPGTIQALFEAAAVASEGVRRHGFYKPTMMNVSAIWQAQAGFEVTATVERRMFLFALVDAVERTYRAGFLGYVSDYKAMIEALRIKFRHPSNLFFTNVPRAVGHRRHGSELMTLVLANASIAHRVEMSKTMPAAVYKTMFNQDAPPAHLYEYGYDELFYDVFHARGNLNKSGNIVPVMMASAQAGVLPHIIKDTKVHTIGQIIFLIFLTSPTFVRACGRAARGVFDNRCGSTATSPISRALAATSWSTPKLARHPT